MNNKCLVTPLPGEVSDNSLMKVDELRVYVNSTSSDSNNVYMRSVAGKVLSATPINGTTWYDGSTSTKTSRTITDRGTTGAVISIRNKYDIDYLGERYGSRMNLIGDIEQLRYCTALKILGWTKAADIPEEYDVYGNMSSLENLTNLICIDFRDNIERNLKGNIDSLINCTSLEILRIRLGGNLATTRNMNHLVTLDFSTTANYERYHGDLNDIGGVNTLEVLSLEGNADIRGQISDLGNHKKLTSVNINGAGMSGVTGSLESLIEAMASGTGARTTGTIAIKCNEVVTLNGNVVGGNVTKTYNFETGQWS